jgi:hypothetical protein
MERDDRPYGDPPTETEVAGTLDESQGHLAPHDFSVGDRVRLVRDYTFGDRSYPSGFEAEVVELDVMTYGATEGTMQTLGARIRFDEDPSESAAWAPYTLLEPVARS